MAASVSAELIKLDHGEKLVDKWSQNHKAESKHLVNMYIVSSSGWLNFSKMFSENRFE